MGANFIGLADGMDFFEQYHMSVFVSQAAACDNCSLNLVTNGRLFITLWLVICYQNIHQLVASESLNFWKFHYATEIIFHVGDLFPALTLFWAEVIKTELKLNCPDSLIEKQKLNGQVVNVVTINTCKREKAV